MGENTSKPSHSFFSFWENAILAGWKESREKFGSTIDTGALILGVVFIAFAWWSKHHKSFDAKEGDDAMSYWFAVIPVGLWLMWFLYHVLKAPYEIYKDQFDKHQIELSKQEQKMEAKLEKLGESLAGRGRKIEELEQKLAERSEADKFGIMSFANPFSPPMFMRVFRLKNIRLYGFPPLADAFRTWAKTLQSRLIHFSHFGKMQSWPDGKSHAKSLAAQLTLAHSFWAWFSLLLLGGQNITKVLMLKKGMTP